MATKTPRVLVKDFLKSAGTENEAKRTLRRRSMGEDTDNDRPVESALGSASKRQGRKDESTAPVRVLRSAKKVGSVSHTDGDGDVTPRHLIQNMLTVQGTGQPITRRQKRSSMGPPSSVSTRKTAKRRSLSGVDLDDVTRRFTPRTNIQGFLEQAPEETPALRKTTSNRDSHSTTQNVSSFMLNEVGVSMLEGGSGSGFQGNVSASGGRFRGKKRQLTIPLPQATPELDTETPEHRRSFANLDATAHRSITMTAASDLNSPTVTMPREELGIPDTADETTDQTEGPALNMTTVSERGKSSERNIFSDVFGGNDDTSASHHLIDNFETATEKRTPVQTPQRETLQIQGGQKGKTPGSGRSQLVERTPLSADKGAEGELSTSNQSSSWRSSGKRSSSTKKISRMSQQPSQRVSVAEAAEVEGSEEDPHQEASDIETPATSTPIPSAKHITRTPVSSISHMSSQPSTPRSVTRSRKSLTASGNKGNISTLDQQGSRASSSADKSQGQLLSDKGDGSQRQSRSSVVTRLSSRFENVESTHSITQPGSEKTPAQEVEGDSLEAGVFPETTTSAGHELQMPDLSPGISDQEDQSDLDDDYSPLKTPHLPVKQRTPNTAVSAGRNKNAGEVQSKPKAGVRRKTTGSRSAKKPRLGLPTSVVKATFTHFCQLRVSKDAIEEVEKMSEQYWKNMAEDLEAYATHARRHTINESDVELLMKRQGFITDSCSLNTLIAKYLPLELRQELIPVARSGNKLEPVR